MFTLLCYIVDFTIVFIFCYSTFYIWLQIISWFVVTLRFLISQYIHVFSPPVIHFPVLACHCLQCNILIERILLCEQDDLDMEISHILLDDSSQPDTYRQDTQDMKQNLRMYIQKQTKFLKECRDIKVNFLFVVFFLVKNKCSTV